MPLATLAVGSGRAPRVAARTPNPEAPTAACAPSGQGSAGAEPSTRERSTSWVARASGTGRDRLSAAGAASSASATTAVLLSHTRPLPARATVDVRGTGATYRDYPRH